jgi:hypothetical protein
MSNATQHSRQSGDQRRRRSRGGKSRSRGRSGGSHESRDNRHSSQHRSEEFRPTGPRPPRNALPPKPLTWWQKLLQKVGLYKAPAPQLRPAATKPAPAPAAVKSNTRNARSSEPKDPPRDGGSPPRRERRPDTRPRGGDRNSVESARVYVGNLSYDVTEQDLQELFKGVGSVRGVEIVYNRSTHRSKGYGFVEMLHKDEAMRAVEILHDQHFMGRKLIVSGAKSKGQDEREERGGDEDRGERESRPVVVAPVAGAETDTSEEPQIATVIESVVETAPETPVAETPAAETPAAETPAAETPAEEVPTPEPVPQTPQPAEGDAEERPGAV